MKKLFFLLYICIGVFILFQASRLVGISIERRVLVSPPDADFSAPEVREPLKTEEYELVFFNSPLFTVTSPGTGISVGEEIETVDSPLLRKYELSGVIMLPDDRSIALIRKARERESGIYRKGDMIDNLEVVGIEKRRVLLHDGFKAVGLPMYYTPQQKISKNASSEESNRRSDDIYGDAKQITKVLSRSDVESKVFNRVNEILTKIAISPYMEDGKMEGMRLIKVPNDSIVYELGGRNGDIIRRVNGHELNRIDQSYKLWENIKDDSRISVDLERKNQIFTYEFDIRE